MALKLRPAEWVLVGYATFVIVVGLSRVGRYPAVAWAIAAHGLLIVVVALWQSPRLGPVGRFLRDAAPMLLLLALYGSLDLLSGFGAEPTHDVWVRNLEATLFGGQISQWGWQRYPNAIASAGLHAAYLSYYLIVPFPLALFLARRDWERLRDATLLILVSFVGCYVWFVLHPVAGPYYEFARPPASFLDNWPAQTVYGILAGGSSYGAAFPSSHVAATWAAAAGTWTGSRRWGLCLAAASAALTVSVVYCQMHYAVDALAGLAVAAVAVLIARIVARR